MPESNSDSMPEMEATTPRNFFSRLAGVYVSPGSAFQEIGRAPRVLVPIIVLIVIGFLQGFYLTKKMDMQSMLANMAAAQGQMTQEQQARMEQQMLLVSKFQEISILVGTGIGSLLYVLIIAGGFKLICKLIEAENGFKAVFSVTAYTVIAVSIISFGLLVLIVSFKDPGELTPLNMRSIVSSNLGAILAGMFGENALPKFLMKLAGFVDVFAIWYIALLAIGYSAVSRKLKTSTVAIWLSVIYGIIAVIGAGIGSLIG